MNIDQKIKTLLEEESQQIDELMLEEKGMFGMIAATFKGGNRIWLAIVYLFGILAGIAMAWTGYRFWIAEQDNDLIFFGFLFIFAMQVQISLKLWGFMEMNRISMIREIKRVEIQLVKSQMLNK